MDYKQNRGRYLTPLIKWAKTNKSNEKKASTFVFSPEKTVAQQVAPETKFHVPTEFNGKDYLTMLLQIDAEIEHGLMLQYLYAAYSLGGDQVPETHRETVRTWQTIILGIAKEEMGHFISVQNALKIIGAPLNFGRESYPWDTPFYPFPFTLEKFSRGSLAKYIYAEAPKDWLAESGPLATEIKELVSASVSDPHTVGALFKVILQLIEDPTVIPDETFQASTYPYQAKFDEWGRGYAGGNRGNDKNDKDAPYKNSPDVLVAPLLSRDDTYKALSAIAEQGEGDDIDDKIPSHFERFLFIYQQLNDILEKDPAFSPARNVATNPVIGPIDPAIDDSFAEEKELQRDVITNTKGILWANLFDIRYRLLLNFLNHSFLLDNGNNASGINTPRGLIINSTFGEMYNLRSLATILVQTDLTNQKTGKMAGPPFTLPYTFDLPFGEHNRWRMHKDLLKGAANIINKLKAQDNQPHRQYLQALQEADRKLMQAIVKLTEQQVA